MPEINGENLVPNGGLTGAAYVLGKTGPDVLSILVNSQRTRANAEQKVVQPDAEIPGA